MKKRCFQRHVTYWCYRFRNLVSDVVFLIIKLNCLFNGTQGITFLIYVIYRRQTVNHHIDNQTRQRRCYAMGYISAKNRICLFFVMYVTLSEQIGHLQLHIAVPPFSNSGIGFYMWSFLLYCKGKVGGGVLFNCTQHIIFNYPILSNNQRGNS